LTVNGRSDFCAPLKAFGGKEETGKAPENGKTNRPDAGFRAFGILWFMLPIFFAVTKPTRKVVPHAIWTGVVLLEMARVAGLMAADDSVDSVDRTAKNHPPRLSIPSKNP
jgi:hypothetical protein